jgi:hypothetical protein
MLLLNAKKLYIKHKVPEKKLYMPESTWKIGIRNIWNIFKNLFTYLFIVPEAGSY